MSLADNMLFAADTIRVQSGGKSYFDTAVDAFTKAPVAAAVSAATSIYNTGVWYNRKLFDGDMEELDTLELLNKVDSNWGDYYSDNKNILDIAGFIGGSIVPGGLALKGLQLARAGKIGQGAAHVLGYTQNKQVDFLRKGLNELAQQGGTVFHRLNTNKILSMASGAADNVLQAAVFETATAAAMHQAPMLAGEDWKDVSWDIVKTSLAGGLFAGAIEGVLVNRIFKDAGKLIDKRTRSYDTIAAVEKLDLGFGDKAFSVIEAIDSLPKQVLDSDKLIDFSFKLNGKTHSAPLDTGGLMERKLAENIHAAQLKFQQVLVDAVPADTTVGRAVAPKLLELVQEGRKAGKSIEEIHAKLGEFLFGLKKMEGLAAEEVRLAEDVVYLMPGVQVKAISEIGSALTTTRVSDAAQGYRIVGDVANTKIAAIGIDAMNLKDAWAGGYDWAIKHTGEIAINPASSIYRKVQNKDDEVLRVVFNTRSGTTSDSALASIADMGTASVPLKVTDSGVVSGHHTIKVSVESFKPDMSALEVTARHLWAGEKLKSLHGVTIDHRDFSLLDALLERPELADTNTMIRLADGKTLAFEDLNLRGYSGWLKDQKLAAVTEWYANSRRGYGLPASLPELAESIRKAKSPDERRFALYLYLTKFMDKKRKEANVPHYEYYFTGKGSDPDYDRGVARYVHKYQDELHEPVLRALHSEDVLDRETGETLNALFDGIRGGHVAQLGEFFDDHYTAYVSKLAESDEIIDPRLVAYRLNTEAAWVEAAAKMDFNPRGVTTDGMFRPLKSYNVRDNVVFGYDRAIYDKMMSGDGSDFMSPILDYHQRVLGAVQKGQEASAAVLGGEYQNLLDYRFNELHKQADQSGVGAGLVSFANADYGDKLRVWSQDLGAAVNQISQRRTNKVLTQITPAAAEILNDAALGVELGALTNFGRLSSDKLALFNGRLVDKASLVRYQRELEKGAKGAPDTIQFKISKTMSPKTYAFLQEHAAIHTRQAGDRNLLATAMGIVPHIDPTDLYFPPINTKRAPYFVFVRPREGTAFASSESVMVTAKNASELEAKVARIQQDYPNLQVFTKKDTENYYKAKGLYDYQQTLHESQLNSFLQKEGIIGDLMPTTDSKQVIEDYIEFYQRRERLITQEAVQVNFQRTFSELQWLSDRNKSLRESKVGYIGNLIGKTTIDPFGDYMRTALDESKRTEFQLWHQMNEFVDAVGTRAYDTAATARRRAMAGEIDWQEANRIMEGMGIAGPFKSQEGFLLAQSGNDRNLIKMAVAKGNMLLANVTLRLDTANSLVNMVSLPLLLGGELSSIRNSLKNHPELMGKLAELLTVRDPATGAAVPTTLKLMHNAIKSFWGPERAQLMQRFREISTVKTIVSQFHEMISSLALTPDLVPTKWAKLVTEWTEKGATFTGNNFAEDFTRFVASDVMRQLTQPLVEAGRMSIKEQNAMMRIFVNRVQGNYITSQRPIIFQGTIGAAIGLFQTYQFNLIQQLFRHIGDRNARTVAYMGAMQTGLFGLNGLPMFEAINTHLIGQASINEGHKDMYSTLAAANKDIGDWLLYGTPSAFPLFSDKMPSLYTRGDLNPRHPTIIPVSPGDLPLVEAGSRVINSILNTGKMIINGADLGPSLLSGLEHNGVSRPLAGIAQLMQGHATYSKGGLIAASSDWHSIATLSRAAGSRPMDESVAVNHRFRQRAYQAADQERLETLGMAVKSKIRSGGLTADDITDFAAAYASKGGRIEGYSAALQRWFKAANQSDVNIMMQAHRSEYGKRMIDVMGGTPLDDYVNNPPESDIE